MPKVAHSHDEPVDQTQIARFFRLRYWNNETAEQVIAAWRKSGESKKEFLRRFDVTPYRLEHWERLLRKEKEPSRRSPVPVYPVKVNDATRAARRATVRNRTMA